METLQLLNYPRERQRIVVLGESKVGLLLSEVEKSLRMPVRGRLPCPPDVADSGGVPIVLADPDHPTSRALQRFAAECLTGRRQQRGSAATSRNRRRDRPVATLGTRLRAHAEQTARTCGLNTHFDVDDQPAPAAARCTQGMLRVGYEAIAHVCKHAGADNLWLTVRVAGPVVVRVEDDGTAPLCKRQDSYQWRTLKDIATQNNLYLAIGPRDHGGTIIEITAV